MDAGQESSGDTVRRPLPAASLRRHLAALDGRELADFVADCYAARGWAPDIRPREGDSAGHVVVLTADGEPTTDADRARDWGRGCVDGIREGESVRLVVFPGGRLARARRRLQGVSLPPGTDRVVSPTVTGPLATAAERAGVASTDAGDLRDLLAYGMARDRAASLVESNLGTAFLVDATEAQSVGNGTGTDGDPSGLAALAERLPGDGGATSGRALTAVLLVVLAVVSVGATAGVPLAGLVGPEDTQRVPDRTFENTPFPPTQTEPDESLPPGLMGASIQNVSALVNAHDRAVSGESYRVEVRFVGPPAAAGFQDYDRVEWWVALGERGEYRFEGRYRRPASNASANATHVEVGIYGVGRTEFRRVVTGNETSYTRVPSGTAGTAGDQTEAVVERLLRRYLGRNGTTVEPVLTAEGEGVLVVVRDPPRTVSANASDYEARALFTAEGRLLSLSVEYTLETADGPKSVDVSVQYGPFGNVTVDRPPWFEAARNATG